MTVRLFDDGHIREFDAVVLECGRVGDKYEVVLDKTAFFPNGGGQSADTGTLGNANVLDVNERKDMTIVHLTDMPFEIGRIVHGRIDWEQRFRRMQNHTGEHIVCGVAHRLFGCENTGFHMGTFGITADLSVLLDGDKIKRIEQEANRIVFENVPVRCFYPDEEALSVLDYRSKLDLTENVRLVEIGEYDLCACCAPHVAFTGEVGMIKILEHSSNRGGTRLLLKCGADAYEDYCRKSVSVAAISASLCAKQEEIFPAVEALKEEKARLEHELDAMKKQALVGYISKIRPSDGNVCVFADDVDADGMREIVNAGKAVCGGVFGCFSADANGYRYCLGSTDVDLRAFSVQFNKALNGRGGGRPEMIQGSVCADKEKILSFLDAEEI